MNDELHAALGAGPPEGVDQVTLFVPSVDREGRPIDQEYWTAEALAVFGKLFRGATAFPRGRGVWRDDERDGQLIHDDTQMVTSYVAPEALSDSGVLSVLREFLCRLGIHAFTATKAKSALL